MISIWATIIVAVLSSSSALIAGFMSNRSNENRLKIQAELDRVKEFQKIRLQKAEELYIALGKYKNTIFNNHMDWVALAKDETDLNKVMNRSGEHSLGVDMSAVYAIMGIYFPNLLVRFDASRELLKPANSFYLDMVHGRIHPNDDKRGHVNVILESGRLFDAAIDDLLIELSRDVNS